MIAFEKQPWVTKANCLGVDPNLMFPERGDTTAEAKAVCAGCVCRQECLEYALTVNEQHGVWGGRSAAERRAIRKQRRQAREPAA